MYYEDLAKLLSLLENHTSYPTTRLKNLDMKDCLDYVETLGLITAEEKQSVDKSIHKIKKCH